MSATRSPPAGRNENAQKKEVPRGPLIFFGESGEFVLSCFNPNTLINYFNHLRTPSKLPVSGHLLFPRGDTEGWEQRHFWCFETF